MTRNIIGVVSWIIVGWICKVFLSSIPYKFSGHPDTQHIFGTIGQWIEGTINKELGQYFTEYAGYVVGTFESIVSVILLLPILFFIISSLHSEVKLPSRSFMHALGGLMASGVMAGAAFFHVFTPLGIEVIHNGKSDNGFLFYAAVSIVLLGLVLFFINLQSWLTNRKLGH